MGKLSTGFIAIVLLAILSLLCNDANAAPLPLGSGPLRVCYAGNTTDLSSDGCACSSNNECIGTCSAATHTCGAVTNVAVCSAPNNGFKASSSGCPCIGNNDCQGVCGGSFEFPICGGIGSTNGPICVLGNNNDISADGCPCTLSGECVGACNVTTDTCQGVVAQVDDVLPIVNTGASTTSTTTGIAIFDSAFLGSALHPSGTLTFRLFGPGDTTCTGSVLSTTNRSVTANGSFTSNTFVVSSPGIYRWKVQYSGDAYNQSVIKPCNAIGQNVNVVVDLIYRNGFQP